MNLFDSQVKKQPVKYPVKSPEEAPHFENILVSFPILLLLFQCRCDFFSSFASITYVICGIYTSIIYAVNLGVKIHAKCG